MNPEILADLRRFGALKENDHFILKSGKHSRAFVDWEKTEPYTHWVRSRCQELAEQFRKSGATRVIGPAKGGIVISHCVANALSDSSDSVLGLSADKTPNGDFVIPASHGHLIAGERFLFVDDIFTEGTSFGLVQQKLEAAGGVFVGIGVMWKRGAKTSVTVKGSGSPLPLVSLITKEIQTWTPEQCVIDGPCSERVAYNMQLGQAKRLFPAKS